MKTSQKLAVGDVVRVITGESAKARETGIVTFRRDDDGPFLQNVVWFPGRYSPGSATMAYSDSELLLIQRLNDADLALLTMGRPDLVDLAKYHAATMKTDATA